MSLENLARCDIATFLFFLLMMLGAWVLIATGIGILVGKAFKRLRGED